MLGVAFAKKKKKNQYVNRDITLLLSLWYEVLT